LFYSEENKSASHRPQDYQNFLQSEELTEILSRFFYLVQELIAEYYKKNSH